MPQAFGPESTIVILAVAAFIAFWYLVLNLIARLGGWHKLASAYPMPGQSPSYHTTTMSPIDKTATFGSLSLRGGGVLPSANYNGVITFRLNASALILSTFFPFKPGHEQIYIPFTDISAKQVSVFLGFKAVEFSFAREQNVRAILLLKRAQWIEEHANGAFAIGQ